METRTTFTAALSRLSPSRPTVTTCHGTSGRAAVSAAARTQARRWSRARTREAVTPTARCSQTPPTVPDRRRLPAGRSSTTSRGNGCGSWAMSPSSARRAVCSAATRRRDSVSASAPNDSGGTAPRRRSTSSHTTSVASMASGRHARRTFRRRSVTFHASRASRVSGMESSRPDSVSGREMQRRRRSRSSGAFSQAVMSSSTGSSATTPSGTGRGRQGLGQEQPPARTLSPAGAGRVDAAPRSKLHGTSRRSRTPGRRARSDQACRGWSSVIALLALPAGWSSVSRTDRVDEIEQLGQRDDRRELGVGADVVAGAEHQQALARGEHGVEELGPLLAAGVTVAHAGNRRDEVLRGGKAARAGVVVEAEQAHHRVGHPALGGERRHGDGAGAEAGPATATDEPGPHEHGQVGGVDLGGAGHAVDRGLRPQLLEEAFDGPPLPRLGVGHGTQVGECVGQRRAPPVDRALGTEAVRRRCRGGRRARRGHPPPRRRCPRPPDGGRRRPGRGEGRRPPWWSRRAAGRGRPARCGPRGRPGARRPRGRRGRGPSARWWPRPTR